MKNLMTSIFLLSLCTALSAQPDCLISLIPLDGNANPLVGPFEGEVFGAEATDDQFGNPESALLHDGEDDFVRLNDNEPIITDDVFTVVIRARLDGMGGGQNSVASLFQQRSDPSNAFNSSLIVFHGENSSGNMYFLIRKSNNAPQTGNVIKTPAPADGLWHCYAIQVDETDTMRVFVDGYEIANQKLNQSGDYVTNIDHVQIGRHSYDGGASKGQWNGAIDEFRLYECALSAAEIAGVCREVAVNSHEEKESRSLSVFPNPATNIIHILDEAENDLDIDILDIYGNIILRKNSMSNRLDLNLNDYNLPAGIYIVRAQNDSRVKVVTLNFFPRT